ncbi:Aste57867_431 [Aphanomyces stellatus]|uniref:Aste57867_431 protein n=1 Tax=Aphanomyces stellatus TaxID=120398 RepID=A0A485K3L1_9STRA|nr:hypothetical protein As57867_000430 [Aphanomyces stellatus]VFT77656.1 Aste57867_431 [Aphanomyces stellatus]
MPKLFCVVVGHEGSPFSVNIAADETVDDLKDKIKEKNMYQFPAKELELYLAKNGLSRDEAKAATLDEDGKNDYHFGMNFQPEEGNIYVLVVVPREMPPNGKRSIEELGEILDERLNKFFKDRDEKRSVYSLSDMNSEKKRRILQKMGLTVNVLRMKEPCDVSIPGYPWIDEFPENQEDQRDQYMAYLEIHLMTLLDEDVFSLVDIANNESVLNTEDPRLPFRIKGTADVLLVKSNVTNLIPMAGLCIAIELRRTSRSIISIKQLVNLCALALMHHSVVIR